MKRKRRAFGCVKARTRTGKRCVFAVFNWGGRRYERTAPDRETAEQNLDAARVALARGASIDTVLAEVFKDELGSRLTFRDAVPKYLTEAETRKKASTWAGDVRRFRVLLAAPWAGNFLGSIRSVDLQRWAESRRVDASGATVNRDLALTSALYRWAIRLGYADANPVKRVERFSEKGRAREVYLTREESRALVSLAAPALRPVLVCALSTGMRRGELLALAWGDVDLARREVHVRAENEKAGRGRAIPMTEDLHAELSILRASARVLTLDGTAHVFTFEDGRPLSESALRSMFDSAVERCAAIPLDKRPRVSFHTLRHSCASMMVAAGVPLYDVAKVLGHSTLAVTMRYAHFAPEAGRDAIAKLGKSLSLGGGATALRVAEGGGLTPN